MPLDTSIYGMIKTPQAGPSPLDSFGQVMSIKGLMDQQGLHALQRRQLEKGIADEEAVGEAYRTAGGDPMKVRDLLYGRGLYKPAQALEKSIADRKRTEADAAKTEMETISKGMGILKDRLATVRDEASYAAYVESAKRLFGPDNVKKLNLPPSFDPMWVRNQLVKAEELFTPKPQEIDLGGTRQVIDMNPFTNPSIVGSKFAKTMTPGERDTSARGWAQIGQSREQFNRGRVQYDPARGGTVNLDTGEFKPATADGKPLGPDQKSAREDADNLRKEFEGKEAVKSYRAVVPIVNAARTAPDTKSGDIQMAYAVGKILDPNSVVREGELKLVGDAATVLEKYKGELSALVAGKGRLTPQTRAELIAMLDNAAQQRSDAYQAERGTFEGIVSRRGYKPEDVFIGVPEINKPKSSPVAPTTAAARTNMKAGGVTFLGFE